MTTTLPIRYSPSGTILGYAGPGMVQRLAQNKSNVSGGTQNIPTAPTDVGFTLGGTPLEAGFADGPVDKSNYTATMIMDVSNTSNAPATVQLDLFVDFGDGNGFVAIATGTSTHTVDAGTARQIRVDAPVQSSPQAATTAIYKAKISNSLDSTHLQLLSPTSGPTLFMEVKELSRGLGNAGP